MNIRNFTRLSPMLLLVAVLLAVIIPANASARKSEQPVPLYPGLPDKLDAADAQRYGLYSDVADLQELWFVPAPWGGYLVRLRVAGPEGERLLERNVPQSKWVTMRQQVAAVRDGAEAPPVTGVAGVAANTTGGDGGDGGATTDTTRVVPQRVLVWPEVGLPPAPPPRPHLAEGGQTNYPRVGGRWVSLLEVGVRSNVSSFRDFFTEQVCFGMQFGYTVTDYLMPFLGFDVGFGDIRSDFEKLAGDGRANTYNFTVGVLGRAAAGRRTAFYTSVAGGYFARTMQWGGTFYDPNFGSVTDGFVLEQQHWGIAMRAGLQFQQSHARRLRSFDIGITVQITPAERWDYYNEQMRFVGDLSDTWVSLSIRFWDTL